MSEKNIRYGQYLGAIRRHHRQVSYNDVIAAERALLEADTCFAPGYSAVSLRNASSDQPAFIFIADESPLHRKLGVLENRG